MNKRVVQSVIVAAVLACAALSGFAQDSKPAKAMQKKEMLGTVGTKVIELAQIPGEFEPKELSLKPGKYIFKVSNKSVDHKVGLALVELTADGKDGKQVPNSGLDHYPVAKEIGTSGVVELKAGKYAYFCPLNPTPHYILTVK